jgi:hypothetical protein
MKSSLKLLAIFIFSAMVMFQMPPSAMAMYGDLTEDGFVDVSDAIFALQVTAQVRTGL